MSAGMGRVAVMGVAAPRIDALRMRFTGGTGVAAMSERDSRISSVMHRGVQRPVGAAGKRGRQQYDDQEPGHEPAHAE